MTPPWVISVDTSANCIFVKWSSNPKLTDVRTYFQELMRIPALAAGANVFNDVRALSPDLPTSFFRQAARLGPDAPNTGAEQKLALLVSSDVGFGLMRVFATFRQRPGIEIEVFDSLEEAKAWLGLPAEIGDDPFAAMDMQ